MKKEKFKIEIDSSAFDAESQRGNLHGKKEYTSGVAEMQRRIESLDRYDDFRSLKINPESYERALGEQYGIERGAVHSGGEVIFAHQKQAAISFLRDLRGFGLLADVVGSGKTFEAGVILSELAIRNKVKSLMIVAPNQVFDTWVDVLENQFGLGKNVLYQVRYDEKLSGDGDFDEEKFGLNNVLHTVGVEKYGEFIRPKRPIIVSADVFTCWHNVPNLLIDVIVVDEAHHLSEEEGKYTNAMRLLSEMMQTKKRAEATYCLLLSATPHSGNLENMFRLWYFIRCKGGNPSDFEEKDDEARSPQYLKEKEYYKQYICRGATNVSEFIRKVKYGEVTQKHAELLSEFLNDNGLAADFEKKSEYERSVIIDAFLSKPKFARCEQAVMKNVARAYHNGVLRSIMIRQPNHLSKKKQVKNVFFFPMANPVDKISVKGLKGERIELDYSKLDENYSPTVICGEESLSLFAYIEAKRGNRPYSQAYGALVNGIITAFAKADGEANFGNGKKGGARGIFTKRGYPAYYSNRFIDMSADMCKGSQIVPVKHGADKLGYKLEYAKKILSEHKNQRVLVFFDYELSKKELVCDEFIAALSADSKFKDRIIVGEEGVESEIVDKFNKKDDAVLIVKSAGFTEGANLQACNIIINYQVTPDPLAMDQRIGRIFRLGQKNNVEIYSLADMNKLEGFALAYFAGIGLLSSNSGDATILAGSNSDQMVAVRCKECRKVLLMPRQEYEEKKHEYERTKDLSSQLLCTEEQICRDNSPDGCGTLMTEISVYDFKCDSCGIVLSRSISDEGYLCISSNNTGEKGKMCNSGEAGDRSVYCRKICALSNCLKFKEDEYLQDCAALKLYRRKPTVGDSELALCCSLCTNKHCLPKCKITDIGAGQISGCSKCQYAECKPKPYVLEFNDKWEAECPSCREKRRRGGKLKPVVARTFATYIRESWKFEHDGGTSFCDNLDKEANKVLSIKQILEDDRTD